MHLVSQNGFEHFSSSMASAISSQISSSSSMKRARKVQMAKEHQRRSVDTGISNSREKCVTKRKFPLFSSSMPLRSHSTPIPGLRSAHRGALQTSQQMRHVYPSSSAAEWSCSQPLRYTLASSGRLSGSEHRPTSVGEICALRRSTSRIAEVESESLCHSKIASFIECIFDKSARHPNISHQAARTFQTHTARDTSSSTKITRLCCRR